jgi:hypothetical protein
MKTFKIILQLFSVIISLSLFYSCDTGTIEPLSTAKKSEYYPLKKGAFIIYNVKKINYNGLGTNDTLNYFLKELVKEKTSIIPNDTIYLIERYTKNNLASEWKIDSIWSARIDQNRIIKQEQNISFIKLTFPEKEGLEWNGNALNTLPQNQYVIQNFEKPYQVENINFPITLTVQQRNENTIVNADVRKEIFAKNIGLIYKYSFVVKYVSEPTDPLYNTNYPVSGFLQEDKFIESGVE